MQAEGGKGESKPAWETGADTGMRRGAQGRAAEAGGWWVRAKYRWVALRTRRAGG